MEPAVVVLRAIDVWVPGRRGHPALAGIGLALVPGRALGVAGGEGGARRALLCALAGTLPIARGEILLGGRPASEDPRGWRRSVGLSLPRAPRAPNLRVDLYLRAAGEILGLPRREAARRASELLDSLALSSHARVPLIRLAAPESTRLELARVLVPDPEIILLDGAVSGFEGDVEAVRRFLDLLRGAGKALLLAEADAAPLQALGVPVRFLAGARLLPPQVPITAPGCVDVVFPPPPPAPASAPEFRVPSSAFRVLPSALVLARHELAIRLAGPFFHAALFSLAALASLAIVLRYVQDVSFAASLLSGEPWRDIFRLQSLLLTSAAAIAGPCVGAGLLARNRSGLPPALVEPAPLPPLAVFAALVLAGLSVAGLLLAAALPPVLACRALGGPGSRELAAAFLGTGALVFFGLSAGVFWAVFLRRLAPASLAACFTALPAAILAHAASPGESLATASLAAAAGVALLLPAALVWRPGDPWGPGASAED